MALIVQVQIGKVDNLTELFFPNHLLRLAGDMGQKLRKFFILLRCKTYAPPGHFCCYIKNSEFSHIFVLYRQPTNTYKVRQKQKYFVLAHFQFPLEMCARSHSWTKSNHRSSGNVCWNCHVKSERRTCKHFVCLVFVYLCEEWQATGCSAILNVLLHSFRFLHCSTSRLIQLGIPPATLICILWVTQDFDLVWLLFYYHRRDFLAYSMLAAVLAFKLNHTRNFIWGRRHLSREPHRHSTQMTRKRVCISVAVTRLSN